MLDGYSVHNRDAETRIICNDVSDGNDVPIVQEQILEDYTAVNNRMVDEETTNEQMVSETTWLQNGIIDVDKIPNDLFTPGKHI